MSWTTDAVEANALQWDGRRAGHTEAYQLNVLDAGAGLAWWFRYSIEAPSGGEPRATLWGAAFSAKEPSKRFALRSAFPAREFAHQSDGFHIRVSKGELSLVNAKGGLKSPNDDDQRLRWNIALKRADRGLQLYPKRSLYRRSWPPTKALTPVTTARAAGLIEVGSTRHQLEDAFARQTHVWGTGLFERWAWGHATRFREDPDASIEAIVGEPSLGERRVLAAHLATGHGERRSFKGMRLGTSSEERPGVWTFTARSRRWTLEGRVSASLQSLAGLTLVAPDGTKRYLHLSGVGDATFELYRQGFGKRHLEATYTARSTAMFEQGGLERFEDVTFFA